MGTKSYLKKIKIADSDLCNLCGSDSETILHLFVHCPVVKDLWTNVLKWIEKKLLVKIYLDAATIIFGCHMPNDYFWSLNFILMIAKQYIFSCARNKIKINIFHLQQVIKEKYEEQNCLAFLNCQEHFFSKKWIVWKELFTNL